MEHSQDISQKPDFCLPRLPPKRFFNKKLPSSVLRAYDGLNSFKKNLEKSNERLSRYFQKT